MAQKTVLGFKLYMNDSSTAGEFPAMEFVPLNSELKEARHMHQSAIVKGPKGTFKLVVLGGKTSDKNVWLNSVQSMDLS